jgi:hypothetical protein
VEQQSLIRAVAKEMLPDIKTVSFPSGSNVAAGLDVVVKSLKEHLHVTGQAA